MRRTVALLVGLCTLVALAGAAVARDIPRTATLLRAGQAARVEPAAERIGTVEETTGRIERRGRLVNGRRTMTFTHPGASYVKVHFSRLLLLPGDRVTVADPAGRESSTYTSRDLGADAWAMSVTGDTAVVTLEHGNLDPLGLRGALARLGVTVDRFARGFTGTEDEQAGAEARARKAATVHSGREESVCGTDDKRDAVCYKTSNPVAYQRSKAVARLLINGVELCTAWRVGPNNRMFTNNHCISSQYEVSRSEVWFNYECAACGGFAVLPTTKVWGDQLLANDSTLDYALFTVRNFENVTKFGYLLLDLSKAVAGQEVYIAHHPRGRPTMISVRDPGERSGNCAVADPQYDGYGRRTDVSYYCDTEGGSSGSPVLSRATNMVIALHHFGGCPNSGVRIDLIYAQLAAKL
jgi:lysyl endopeptidase